jgi:hypothetical protein
MYGDSFFPAPSPAFVIVGGVDGSYSNRSKMES